MIGDARPGVKSKANARFIEEANPQRGRGFGKAKL
jgi:hypothetical protein